MRFVGREYTPPDSTHGRNDPGDSNHPGTRVRKQTRDIASVLKYSAGLGDFYFFTEDDMQLCDHAVMAIQYMLNKAEWYKPNFMSIRASYGMNGIIIRDQDVTGFSDYLLQVRAHKSRRMRPTPLTRLFARRSTRSADHPTTWWWNGLRGRNLSPQK